MNHALPSESSIARLDYLAFNGKVCSSVEYSDEQRFLEDLKESLYHGEPLCVPRPERQDDFSCVSERPGYTAKRTFHRGQFPQKAEGKG